MSINLIFKIAAVGILLVSLEHYLLCSLKVGKVNMAFM